MPRHPGTLWLGRVLLAAFALQATGCHSWRITPQPWPEVQGATHPDRYRLTLRDGRRFEADLIRVAGDSVFARGREVPADDPAAWLGLARSEVVRLEERHASPGRTIALVGAVVVVITAVSVALLMEFVDTMEEGFRVDRDVRPLPLQPPR